MGPGTRLRRCRAFLGILAVAVLFGGCSDDTAPSAPESIWEQEIARLIADEATEEQRPYLEDGIVTPAEREAAFFAYLDCLEASGIEVLDYSLQPLGGDGVQTTSDLEAGTRTRVSWNCRERFYGVISQVFGLQNKPTAEKEAEFVRKAGECLRELGFDIPDGATRDDLKSIAPDESFDCLDEAEGIVRPTFTLP